MPRGSDTYVRRGRKRVTYVEETEIYDELEIIAAERGLSVSQLVRHATLKLLKEAQKNPEKALTPPSGGRPKVQPKRPSARKKAKK